MPRMQPLRCDRRGEEVLDEAERYLAELIDEVGEPSAAEVAKAQALADRIGGRR